MEEGEKKLTKFAPFTSKDEKAEKARDLFLQAATQFKANANWIGAGNAFLRAADMSGIMKSEMDSADDLNNAAMSYKKANDPRATEILERVVDIYDKNGKYSQAAKMCVTIGDMGGKDAINFYQRAITYYRNEGSKATALDIVEKIANLSLQQEEYLQCQIQFDKIARECLDDRLRRGGARKYEFMSLLCQLATLSAGNRTVGIENLKERFEEYQGLDPQFTEHTREHMLIDAVIKAFEADDIRAFDEAVMDYDSICPMDDIKQKLLLNAKQVLRRSDAK